MPEEPTANGGSPGPVTGQPGQNEEQRPPAPPPFGEEYRWHGPSQSAYPGSETQAPYGGQYGPSAGPYGPYAGQYGAYGGGQPPQNPYGPPQPTPPYNWPYLPPSPPRRPPLSPEERRRKTFRAVALAGILVLAVGAGIGIGAAIAPASSATVASTLVSRAVTSATNAGTYEYVELSTAAGAPDDIRGDAAPSSGQQVIKQRCVPVRSDTTNATSVFDLRLVNGNVYFRGNIVAVVDELGVAASRATSLAGRWVKVVKGDKPYTTFERGITTSSNASQLRTAIVPGSTRTVPDSSPPTTEVLGALFKTSKTKETVGTAVLEMNTSTGRPRSLRGSAVLEDTERYAVTWTFTGYGKTVHVVAPSRSVAYSSLHASPSKTACS